MHMPLHHVKCFQTEDHFSDTNVRSIPPLLFVLGMSSAFYVYYFRSDFFHGIEHYDPDLTAQTWGHIDLGSYCLQYRLRLQKHISRREEQATKVVTGGLRFKDQTPVIHATLNFNIPD